MRGGNTWMVGGWGEEERERASIAMDLQLVMNKTNLYPAHEIQGSSQGCIRRRASMFRSFGDDRPVRMRAIISLLVE